MDTEEDDIDRADSEPFTQTPAENIAANLQDALALQQRKASIKNIDFDDSIKKKKGLKLH